MTMHHTTRKKAHDAGLTVVENQQADGSYLYEVSDQRCNLIGSDAKSVVAAVILFHQISPAGEYPFVRLNGADGDFAIKIEGNDDTEYTAPDLEDCWVGFCEEYSDEINEASEAVEEEAEGGSIVPRKYRDEYKARGDATRCSDFLCEAMDPFTRFPNDKGKLVADLEATRQVALANGIEKDWPTLNKGQRCMNWRNMIRNRVKKTGQLVLPAALIGEKADKTVTFPQFTPEDDNKQAA